MPRKSLPKARRSTANRNSIKPINNPRTHVFGRSSNVWRYVDMTHTPPETNDASRPNVSHSISLKTLRAIDEAQYFKQRQRQQQQQQQQQEQEQQQQLQQQSIVAPAMDVLENRENSSTQVQENQVASPVAPSAPSPLEILATFQTPPSGHNQITATSQLSSIKSLPELQVDLAARDPQVKSILAGNKKHNVYPGIATYKKAANEVVKRLQQLGNSNSTPVLGIPGMAGVTTNPSAMGGAVSGPGGAPNSTSIGSAVSGVSATSSLLTDSQKLQNDFNSQQTRLYYGCRVALQLFNGHLMMIHSPEGQINVRSMDHLDTSTTDRAVFTLIDLVDMHNANSIRYGDPVWIQISCGSGEITWEQGGVLGAKVRDAPQLQALALFKDDVIRNDFDVPNVVGHPVPIRAYLPKTRDDGDNQADEIQARVRNKCSRIVGKWIIRSALKPALRRKRDTYVYNNDEIFFEQDWFYLGADLEHSVAVLRQLPSSVALKAKDQQQNSAGEYVVERRAAWRIRLLDSNGTGNGLSLAQQQMEKLLFRARNQLKNSKKMRDGELKSYNSVGIQGGTGFTRQLRRQLARVTNANDEFYLSHQQNRLEHLDTHLHHKAHAIHNILEHTATAAIAAMTSASRSASNSLAMSSAASSNSPTPGLAHLMPRVTNPVPAALPSLASPHSPHSPHGYREGGGSPLNEVKVHKLGSPTANAGSLKNNGFGASSPVAGVSATSPSGAMSPDGKRMSSRQIQEVVEDMCSLCHAPTVGYNLCHEYQEVLRLIQQEQVAAKNKAIKNLLIKRGRSVRGTRRAAGLGDTAGAANATSPLAGDSLSSTNDSSGMGGANAGGRRRNSLLVGGGGDSSGTGNDTTSSEGSAAQQEQQQQLQTSQAQEEERLAKLLDAQDAHLLGVIKFKEKECREAQHAQEQAKVGLSPASSHFRERYKRIAQISHGSTYEDTNPAATGNHHLRHHGSILEGDDDAEDEYDDEEEDPVLKSCPFVFPGEDYMDIYNEYPKQDDTKDQQDKDNANGEHQEDQDEDAGRESELRETNDKDLTGSNRFLPTLREMDAIAPIDGTAVMELYMKNKTGLNEMLLGYIELVEKEIVPHLKGAWELQSKQSLLEMLHFTAAASEFVCARRVQIQVARVLHAMSQSAVGDFTSFQQDISLVVHELDTAVQFIRFFQEKTLQQPRVVKKKTSRALL